MEHHQTDDLRTGKANTISAVSGGSFACRQTSTRWTPTSEQIRILKELYYNNGVRSPTSEQIQRISARLRQYGKIEGKNVFYWFQNHKARERQKKRLIANPNNDNILYNHNPRLVNHTPWRSSDHYSGFASSSNVCQIGNYGGYGSSAMEKSFRDCAISPRENRVGGGSMGQNYGWVGMDPYAAIGYPFMEPKKAEEEEEEGNTEIETLPLFPMHGDDGSVKPDQNGFYSGRWYGESGAGSRASLELSLNSYIAGWSTGSH